MVPFYVYYSMFGFQRIGDLAWAAGDMQARGFLLGGTSGRTTLNGEGLQHEDGHSHILAGTIPNCISYDPTFAHEVARDPAPRPEAHGREAGQRLLLPDAAQRELPEPGLRPGTEEQIIKGMYLLEEAAAGKKKDAPRVNLLGSGTILRESMRAKKLLENDWGVAANVWSCPSFNELARDGQDVRALEPAASDRDGRACPSSRSSSRSTRARSIASTDYMKNYAEQIRPFMPKGRDLQGARHRRLRPQRLPQQAARAFRGQSALRRRRGAEGAGRGGRVPAAKVAEAIKKYGIDADKINPLYA